jgi:hypothetical protein
MTYSTVAMGEEATAGSGNGNGESWQALSSLLDVLLPLVARRRCNGVRVSVNRKQKIHSSSSQRFFYGFLNYFSTRKKESIHTFEHRRIIKKTIRTVPSYE